MKYVIFFACLFFCFVSFGQEQEQMITVKKGLKLMGCHFEITVITQNKEIGYLNIQEATAEITRIDKMISSWESESETSLVNKNAGIKPVKVSLEFFELVQRSKKISKMTNGAFDISYASLDKIWEFDGALKELPSEKKIKASVLKIGYNKIILNSEKQTIFLKDKGMRIGFGAIGKGYAVDKVKELLISKEVKAGLINASGDLTTWGTKASGEKWMVGISNPLNKDKAFSWFPVVESSVATSDGYKRYLVYEGKRYSHIIDPRTGYPTRGINSVSIFGKHAELCDALATAIFIIGRNNGIHLINQIPGIEAVVVDGDNKIYKSSGIICDNH